MKTMSSKLFSETEASQLSYLADGIAAEPARLAELIEILRDEQYSGATSASLEQVLGRIEAVARRAQRHGEDDDYVERLVASLARDKDPGVRWFASTLERSHENRLATRGRRDSRRAFQHEEAAGKDLESPLRAILEKANLA
jgi:hypothetical protein